MRWLEKQAQSKVGGNINFVLVPIGLNNNLITFCSIFAENTLHFADADGQTKQ